MDLTMPPRAGPFDGCTRPAWNSLENKYQRSFHLLRHYIGMNHISDDDLERYDLGMVADEVELTALEEHLLACPECAGRAEEAAAYVETVRAAIIAGGLDL